MATSEMDYMNIGMGNVVSADVDNVVHEFTNTIGQANYYDADRWTATEDCILVGKLAYKKVMTTIPAQIGIGTSSSKIYCQAYGVVNASTPSYMEELYTPVFIPVKKGQEVVIRCAVNCML